MKNAILIISFVCFGFTSFAQNKLFVGAETSYLSPLGTLGDRFDPAPGFSMILGDNSKESWRWSGRMEYFSFTEEDSRSLKVKRRVTTGSVQKDYDIALKSLEMELNVYGVSANLTYDLFDLGYIKAEASAGFGIYRWEHIRSGVKDSLFADTSGTGSPAFIEYLDVPENKQYDWSGGFYGGLKFDVPVYDPVVITLSGHYKGVVGELWPALALAQENVSVFQIMEIKLGINIKL